MRHSSLYLWSLAGMASALMSMNATAGDFLVDVRSVDPWNNPVRMPSDFDDFTPAGMWRYMGPSPEVCAHVRLLQNAMLRAGFWGSRTEWWHYTIAHWQKYVPAEKAKSAGKTLATHWEGRL